MCVAHFAHLAHFAHVVKETNQGMIWAALLPYLRRNAVIYGVIYDVTTLRLRRNAVIYDAKTRSLTFEQLGVVIFFGKGGHKL